MNTANKFHSEETLPIEEREASCLSPKVRVSKENRAKSTPQEAQQEEHTLHRTKTLTATQKHGNTETEGSDNNNTGTITTVMNEW